MTQPRILIVVKDGAVESVISDAPVLIAIQDEDNYRPDNPGWSLEDFGPLDQVLTDPEQFRQAVEERPEDSE